MYHAYYNISFVKLWFTKMLFVSFYSVPNLIVILFNLLYPIFVVGFDCKGCVLERESLKTQAIEARRSLASISRLSFLRSEAYALHITRMRRVSIGWRQLCLASISQVRLSRETFYSTSLYYQIHTFCTHTIYTHITHKWCGELLRENPSKKTWELEIVIPTILYTFVCEISSSPISPFPYHWEVDSTNTYHTLWECQMRFWYYWEVLEEAKDGRCNMELVARSGVLDKTRFREALLE